MISEPPMAVMLSLLVGPVSCCEAWFLLVGFPFQLVCVAAGYFVVFALVALSMVLGLLVSPASLSAFVLVLVVVLLAGVFLLAWAVSFAIVTSLESEQQLCEAWPPLLILPAFLLSPSPLSVVHQPPCQTTRSPHLSQIC